MPSRPAKQTTDLDDQLCFAIYAAANVVIRAYRPLLQDVGLTYPQYLVMLVLWHGDAPTIGELAARLKLPPHALSPIIDRMEGHDLLTRRRRSADQRIVHVELTRAGRDLEQHVAGIQDQVECELSLAPEDVTRIRTDLHRLVDQMTEPPAH